MRAKRILLSFGAVAVVTGAIFALKPVAPVLSLGVLYLFAVLPVAALWGFPLAALVSVVSMLAFNFFFLPPTHTLRLADSENWVALAVYLVTAIGVSELAARARRRADEAERLAELRRSDAVKTVVLRTVSHDLRSPITAIMTASDLLESSSARLSTEERGELYSSIRLQIHRLDRFVSNLLDLSRLEAGAARPLPELWTVDGLVARALDAIGPENERIETLFHEDSPPLSVDPAQIEHALVNVLENALKFSSPIDVVELRTEESDGELLIRIQDHGPGIPTSERDEIFEPFQRGGTTEGRSGSGLGLAIARGFVQLNGGRIWVESEPGRGTTVALAFPAARRPTRAAV